MKVDIESLSTVEKKLTFEIPPERVKEELEKTYHQFQHHAQLKGFRAGKVPRPMLERHFGEQVASEVSSHLIGESYEQALEDHKLMVFAQPHIVAEKLIPGQPFRYSATIEVRPEVTVGQYEGIAVEKRVSPVPEQEVEQGLTRLTEVFAQSHPVTDREEVEMGDVVTIDLTALVDGRPIPGLQAKGRLVEMGKEAILPGFQEQLVGMHKGATKQFSLPLPTQPDEAEAPQRSATFRVTVHELARKEIPALDDEFAKDHGECATLDELRDKVRSDLQRAADRRAQSQMEEVLVSHLLERNAFEVPPSLVHEQERRLLVDARIMRPDDQRHVHDLDLPEAMRHEVTARARRQVQTALLMDALAKQLGLAVSDDELQERITEIGARVGVEQQAQLEAVYGSEENRRPLRHRLLQEKTLQWVVDKATIKTVEGDVAAREEND